MIVTVANRKGGVGKTTTSVFLAHALLQATSQPCVLVDADPQASAAQWAQRVAKAGHLLPVPVLAQPTPRLGRSLPEASNVVIDTPPGDPEIVNAAIALADLVLVPTSASALDLSQVLASVRAATALGKPAAVLITRTRRTRSVGAAEESLRAAGVGVLRTHIPLREALAMAFGRPVRDLHGHDLATAELLDALPEQPYSVDAVRQRTGQGSAMYRKALPAQWATSAPSSREPVPAAAARSAPTGLDDHELIRRLKTSLARLATPT